MRVAGLPLTLLLVLLVVPRASADDVEDLLRRLRSEKPTERREAVAALGDVTAPAERQRARPGLVAALEDPVATVRREAALVLAGYRDLGVAGPLAIRVERETDPAVLAAVLLAAGDVGAVAAVPRMSALAKSHPVASVRSAALTALGRVGGVTARSTALHAILKGTLPDPDWSVRASAMLALARCGHADDVGPVLTAYREGEGRRYWFARAALAELVSARDREPLLLLRQLVLDPDPRVALTAATGIARTGRQREVEVLLRHTSPTVRAAAASAVAREELAYAYPRLRSLARLDRSLRVRWAASLALFRIEDPQGDELVLEALQAKEPTIWAEAMAALAKRTGESYGRNTAAWREALRRWRKEQGR